jgi:4-aminobutyrate aminotransferase/(S)-3-amino-2-methylpropionate transaminase
VAGLTAGFLGGVPGFFVEHPGFRAATATALLAANSLALGAFGRDKSLLARFDLVAEKPAGEETVERLLPGGLAFHLKAGRPMQQHHAGGDLVHVLSAMAAAAHERFLDVGFPDAERGHALGERGFFVGIDREHAGEYTGKVTAISLKTSVPGPKSQALLRRRQAAVPQGPFHIAPIFVEHGDGATVTDVDGNTFLDFSGGLGSLNLGHNNPKVVEAVRAQAGKFLHTCFHIAQYEPYVALAEKLNAITPGRFAKKTLLVNSGAEAVENAVKIARYFTKRPAVVGFEHGFAGRTLLAMSLTSKAMPYKFGFGPFAPEVYRLPYPYEYRGEGADFHEFFHTHVDPKQVACIVMELVLGEGGFVVAPKPYVQALAKFCKDNGILLVADEIQTGFARTGRMFAAEHYDIEPDLITMAKSLAGGMPISAVTGRAEIMDSVHVGGLGGTYGGNPLACVAGLATIAEIERLNLPARARQIGDRLRDRLRSWKHPMVGDVRGLGAMMAVEFVKDRQTKEPAKEFNVALVKRCVEHGVILIYAGTHSNVLRFLVPLVITDAQLDEGLEVIERQLAA